VPPQKPLIDRFSSLIRETRRRRVFRVAGAYIVVAWILMQAGEIVFPAFELPTRALRVLILALLAGLPCTILLAWLLEVTPTGIRLTRRIRERQASSARSADAEGAAEEETSTLGRSLEMILLGIALPVLASAILLAFFTLRSDDEVATGDPMLHRGRDANASTEGIPSLAVLPFDEHSTASGDGGFFARGMHEDVLTQLARVRPLKLISRTSVMAFEKRPKSVRSIGRELGVDHILEGSVRRTPTRVRVTARLIRTETDEQVWAERFDAELEDVLAVQARIAQAIARALESEFAPAADAAIEVASRPTVVPAAYDAYLKARDIHRNLDAEDAAAMRRARQLYEMAIQIDGELAAAWLQLGLLHAQALWFGLPLSPEGRLLARRSLDRARELGIEDDQLALAEGIYAYYVEKDLGTALLHFQHAAEQAAGSSEALFYRAMILRRAGELDQALAAQTAALELDPLNLGQKDEYALTLALAGRLSEARGILRAILRTDPKRLRARTQKWQLDLELDGRPEELLEEILDSPRERWRDQHYAMLETVAILAGRPDDALAILAERADPTPDSGFLDYQRAVLEGFAGRNDRKQALLIRSQKKFRALLDARPEALDGVDRRRIEAMLALGHGRFDEAIRLQSENVELNPIERDLIVGSPELWLLGHILLAAGRTDEATATLERLRGHVALGSIPYAGHFVLTYWPGFAPARSDPRFADWLEGTRPRYAGQWPAQSGSNGPSS